MQEQLKVGIGFDKDTTQGPLINKNALEKVIKFPIKIKLKIKID